MTTGAIIAYGALMASIGFIIGVIMCRETAWVMTQREIRQTTKIANEALKKAIKEAGR